MHKSESIYLYCDPATEKASKLKAEEEKQKKKAAAKAAKGNRYPFFSFLHGHASRSPLLSFGPKFSAMAD